MKTTSAAHNKNMGIIKPNSIKKQRGITLVEMGVYLVVSGMIFGATLIATKKIYDSKEFSYLAANDQSIDMLMKQAHAPINTSSISQNSHLLTTADVKHQMYPAKH